MAQAKKNQALLLFVRRQEYQRRLEDKETWGHVGGRIYSTAKIFFTIGFLYEMVVNLAIIIALGAKISDAIQFPDQFQLATPTEIRTTLYLVVVSTALLLFGFILMLCKKHLPALLCIVLPIAPLLIDLYRNQATQIANNGPARYFFLNVLPLCLMLITAIILYVIHVREKRRENEAYDKLTAAIYQKHAKDDKAMTEEEWEALLEKYAASAGKED